MKFTHQSLLNLALLTLAVIANAHADSSPDLDSQDLLKYSRCLKNGRSMQDLLNHIKEKRSAAPCDFVALEIKLEQAEHDIKMRIEQANMGMASCEAISICQKDIGPTGLIISQPGYYRLKENIEFNPNADFLAAITIQSSNVTLDLNGKTVSESALGFATFDTTQGIVIASGSNNVAIKNGKVKGFSDTGILGASVDYSNPLPSEHIGLAITNIKVTKCGKLNTFNNIQVRNGIGIFGGTSVVIEHCCVSHIASFFETDAIAGYFVEDILIKDCKASYAATPGTDTNNSSGIFVVDFTNCIIDSCSGTNITGSFTVGMGFVEGDTLIVRNSKGNNNQGALIAAGIEVQFATNVLIAHCETNDNSSANIDPTQVLVNAKGIFNGPNNINVIVKDCIANRNGITSSLLPFTLRTYAIGIETDASNSVLIENCSAAENFINPGVSAFNLSGFLILNNCTDVIHRRCLAQDHSSTDDSLPVAGFIAGSPVSTTASFMQQGIIFDECVAKRNVNTANAANGYGILFGIEGFHLTLIDSSILTSVAKCNNTGFRVAGPGTTGNLIEGNTALNNSLFGFLDTSCDSNSYVDNCSCNPKATGVCSSLSCSLVPLSGNANFCGLPAGTPPQKERHCKS